MELSKKTTILFPPDLHERLKQVAAQRGVSLGELVRTAVEVQYGLVSVDDRVQAAIELGEMSLPVGTPEEMAAESVPAPEDLLP